MSAMWKFLWLLAVLSCFQEIRTCYNYRSNGSTEPVGDITLKLGSELVINCTLKESYQGPSNSSDIHWEISKQIVSSKYVSILDERSAQLRIRNISTKYCGNLSCKLNTATLCINQITPIAPIPRKEEFDFKCIFYKWKSVTCQWKVGPSCPLTSMNISTNWTLSYSKYDGRVYCRESKNGNNGWYSCTFDELSVPSYDPLLKTYFWILRVQTPFESKNFSFEMDHYSRVIASPPENLRNSSYESTKLKLVWELDEAFKIFPVPIVYQLKYRSEWDQPDYFKEILLDNKTSFEIDNLIPYTKYSVSIRCRSQTAKDEAMWSTYISSTFETLSAVPVSQVNTTPSNFIDLSTGIDRKVTLFWKPIPNSERFGPNFHYVIWQHSDGEKNVSNIANASSFSYRPVNLLNNKSYWFTIQAANNLGVSPNAVTIFINKSSEKSPEAEDLKVVHLKSGKYLVSWKPPKNVSSYFVVWCIKSSSNKYMQPCYAPLNWISVPANETKRIIAVDDKPENVNYKFAVAVKTNLSTSGLKPWSECIAEYEGIPGKMQMNLLIAEGPTSIRVGWGLDCIQRTVITGFQVQYCSTNQLDDNCKNETVDGAEKRSYTIQNLKPYTYYNVIVSGMVNSQVGEQSDIKEIMTKPAAPSDPPSNLTSTSTSNTSISVHWGLPSFPNGVLTYFLVHYNNSYGSVQLKNITFQTGKQSTELMEKIDCYTNYTITAQACNVQGCSPHSHPLTVLTEIGVPEQPEMPIARVINVTHVILTWDEPAKPNGPIEKWNLFVIKYSDDEPKNSTEEVPSSPFAFQVHCDEDEDMIYGFAIQAVTRNMRRETLMSKWSDLTTLNVCQPNLILNLRVTHFSLAVVFGILALFSVVALAWYCYKSIWPEFKGRNMIPILPVGLIKDGQIGYSDFEKKLNKSAYNSVDDSVSAQVLNRLQSISSDEGRGSQNSTKTTLHETSSFSSINDENMYTDKTSLGHFRNKHNLSSDSSGCSTGEGSVSSTVTTRMHLSSDSGNEADLPTPVTSLDSVFYDTSIWPAGVTSSSQLRLRTLQRLGEEDCALSSSNGERPDTCQLEEDVAQFSANHYYKPVMKKSDIDSATLTKADGMDPGSTGKSNDPSTLTMYSRLALTTPPQSNGYQKNEIGSWDSSAKDVKANNSISINPQSSGQGESKRPASYVALAILSDPSRVQEIVPFEEVVKSQTNELAPYSCVGIVANPPPVSCSIEDQTDSINPIAIIDGSARKIKLPDVSAQCPIKKDVAHLPSVLCSALKKESHMSDQVISIENQKKPKRPSYIALARIDNPSGSGMCQSGYSKVGHRDSMAPSHLPKSETTGNSVRVDKAENVTETEGPLTPAIHGYVTLGLANPGPLKKPPPDMADADSALNECKLSFDVALPDAEPCHEDDGWSWESELEISEENLTEEDIHSVVQQPSSMRGYVCIGKPNNEGGKVVI